MSRPFDIDGGGYSANAPAHDSAGNMIFDGTAKFTYDGWNRLVGVAHAYRDGSNNVQAGQKSITMSYDGRGRRISKAIANAVQWDATYHYYYDNDSLVETRDGSGWKKVTSTFFTGASGFRLWKKVDVTFSETKELAVYALVYNLVHLVMLRAAARQGVPPDRISFLDTLRWLISAAPGEPLPDLLINPHRPHRHEPRVVKDVQDTYTKMSRPRSELRKQLLRNALAA